MYPDYDDVHEYEPVYNPQIEHHEVHDDFEPTYHHFADHEMTEQWAEPVNEHDYRHEYVPDVHQVVAPAPVHDHDYRQEYDDYEYHARPHDTVREVEYGVEDSGPVHMYEEFPEPLGYNFL